MEKNVIRKASLDHCIVMLKLEKGVSWNLPAEQLFVVFLALALTRHTLLLSNSHFTLGNASASKDSINPTIIRIVCSSSWKPNGALTTHCT